MAMPEKIRDMMAGKAPLQRLGDPAEIAAAYLFLASDEASLRQRRRAERRRGAGGVSGTPRNARIVATGMHAPDRVVPNAWFDERLGEDVSDLARGEPDHPRAALVRRGREHGRPGRRPRRAPCWRGPACAPTSWT